MNPPTIGGTQGAMIYLAESLAGLKHEQAQTNALLRELIDLVRTAPAPQSEEEDTEDVLEQMRAFEAQARTAPTAPTAQNP